MFHPQEKRKCLFKEGISVMPFGRNIHSQFSAFSTISDKIAVKLHAEINNHISTTLELFSDVFCLKASPVLAEWLQTQRHKARNKNKESLAL